jgi:hypothetical protein
MHGSNARCCQGLQESILASCYRWAPQNGCLCRQEKRHMRWCRIRNHTASLKRPFPLLWEVVGSGEAAQHAQWCSVASAVAKLPPHQVEATGSRDEGRQCTIFARLCLHITLAESLTWCVHSPIFYKCLPEKASAISTILQQPVNPTCKNIFALSMQ